MIVRGICSPYHVSSKGKLKPEAYDPTPETDEVSVMRADYLGVDGCKEKAKALENQEKGKIVSVSRGTRYLALDVRILEMS